MNLFVKVPSVHPGADAPEYFSGMVQGVAWALIHAPLWLLLHVIAGLLLFLASLILIGFAIAARRRAWIIVSVIGFLGIVLAGFNGASFMNYGHDFRSLFMSIGFLLAAGAYTIGISLALGRPGVRTDYSFPVDAHAHAWLSHHENYQRPDRALGQDQQRDVIHHVD